MPNWFITGCSTGLGRALAEAVLARGWNLTATARRPADIEDLRTGVGGDRCAIEALDVTNPQQIISAVRRAEEQFGGIDVLVNNAGHGLRAAVEEADDAEIRALFEANFFGLVRVIKAALPGMRERRSGWIVNISSVAGRTAQAGNGLYSASKFAVEGMSDGLRKEVGPLGIRVMLVEPGPFRTDFAGRSLMQSASTIADYATTAGLLRKERSGIHGKQPGDPVRAACCFIEALQSEDPPFRIVLGRVASERVATELGAQLEEAVRWKTAASLADFPEEAD